MKWNPPFLNHEKCNDNDKNNRTFGDPIRRQTATDSGTGSQKGGPGEGEGARAEGGIKPPPKGKPRPLCIAMLSGTEQGGHEKLKRVLFEGCAF